VPALIEAASLMISSQCSRITSMRIADYCSTECAENCCKKTTCGGAVSTGFRLANAVKGGMPPSKSVAPAVARGG